jgi:dTDP-4-dehydrorhamnose 3,5-epimerase
MSSSFEHLAIPGLVLIKPRIFPDERGFFLELYKRGEFTANGIAEEFVQDNVSSSKKGVLRGMHFQNDPHAQGRLVHVIEGTVWDVTVDLRKESKTYLQWYGLELSDQNHWMLYIPLGFAHGFVTLSDKSLFQYKCTKEYDKSSENGFRWNDPDISIKWPLADVSVSPKDGLLPFFSDMT